jgi:hypothetical protein
MAAVCATNLGMFELGALAAIERSVEKAIYALLLDPLTAAVCTPGADQGDDPGALRRRGSVPARVPLKSASD